MLRLPSLPPALTRLPGSAQRLRALAAVVLAAVTVLLRPLAPFRLAPGWLVGALLLWALAEGMLLLWRPRRWR
ncbi:MAG: hypothetical protein QM522_11335 [Chitinophagaceae bacterium]|nr:hypothetical protein [Chitinophagaceae bacterium]